MFRELYRKWMRRAMAEDPQKFFDMVVDEAKGLWYEDNYYTMKANLHDWIDRSLDERYKIGGTK